ncbi:MAG: hypothetical protein ACOYVK_20065 [Bacillota bacterium]
MVKEIDLDGNILKKNKIPLLIKDKEWRNIFEPYSTKKMKKIIEEMEDKIRLEKETYAQLKAYTKQKKELMEKILHLSNEANSNNNEEALDKLDRIKLDILKMNDIMDELQFSLEMIPRDLNHLNLELLKETIYLSYEDIKDGGTEIKVLHEDIIKLREQLTEKWEKKLKLEERVSLLYSYLHNTLGHEETDKLDQKFL